MKITQAMKNQKFRIEKEYFVNSVLFKTGDLVQISTVQKNKITFMHYMPFQIDLKLIAAFYDQNNLDGTMPMAVNKEMIRINCIIAAFEMNPGHRLFFCTMCVYFFQRRVCKYFGMV